MIREVTALSSRVRAIVECLPCGMAIATDIVDERYGQARSDWRNVNQGHACKLTTAGLSADQEARITAVVAELGPVDVDDAVAPAPAGYVDSRLPVEPDGWGDADEVSK
jgi:hypothetical protein